MALDPASKAALSEGKEEGGAGREPAGASPATPDEDHADASIERQQCAFFLRTGTCYYGDRCKFDHPSDRQPTTLNSLGYPLRSSEPDCTFWLRKGWCAFGMTCKFNHPELPGAASAVAAAAAARQQQQQQQHLAPQPAPYLVPISSSAMLPYGYYPGPMYPLQQPALYPRMVPMAPAAISINHPAAAAAAQQQLPGVAALSAQLGGIALSLPGYVPLVRPMAPAAAPGQPPDPRIHPHHHQQLQQRQWPLAPPPQQQQQGQQQGAAAWPARRPGGQGGGGGSSCKSSGPGEGRQQMARRLQSQSNAGGLRPEHEVQPPQAAF